MNAPLAVSSREQFLETVRTSGVMSADQWERSLRALTPFQKSAREVADFFTGRGWLTRFQAELLLSGRHDGFLFGSYVVLDYLTKSPTARVYKARHRTMNRLAAVHVLRREWTADAAVQDEIRAHARSAARLAHPNVLTLLDVNTAADRMYLVYEYVEGNDAGALVQSTGPLPVGRACDFCRQAAMGLQHAHEHGISHGRLTPSAVMIGRPGGNGPEDKPVVKVSGFGVGRFTADAAPTGYLPPEARDHAPPTPSADLFALGGILHFLLTGRTPHPATPLRLLRGDLPYPLTTLIDGLLSQEVRHRPGSANEVANVLEMFSHGDSLASAVDFSISRPPQAPSEISSGSGSAALPQAVAVTVRTPVPVATPSPWADLRESPETSADEDASEVGTTDGKPTVTAPARKPRPRRADRGKWRRKRKPARWSFWLGLIGAVVALAAASGTLAVLANLLKH